MSKSSLLRRQLATESLDLATINVEQFRDTATNRVSALDKSTREKLIQLEKSGDFIDQLYDNLLPTLRQITTRSNKRTLHATIADAFLLDEDEARSFTESFRDRRTSRMIESFIDSSKLSSSQKKQVLSLLGNLTATEQTALVEQFLADEAYRSTAELASISFVDPTTPRRSRRAANKRIAREQQTYSDSLKQHRENVAYRMTQLSHIYDGLLEDIIEVQLEPDALVSIANTYNRRTRNLRKQSAKLAVLTKLITPLAEPSIDQQTNQADAIDQYAHIAKICSRVAELSEAQRQYLPERTEEFHTLALDYSRIRSKKTTAANDKLLVI